jgi:hypothetical protein
MRIVLEICLGLLYVICILLCWSYIRGDSLSVQSEDHLKDLKTEKSTK